MFGSSMLDIAIGVSFVYLLLSVFATAINEILLSAFNMRGKELLRGISTLLTDPEAKGLASHVYNHGQIYGLYDGPFNPQQTKSNLPAYIPSRNFALALAETVKEHVTNLSAAAVKAAADPHMSDEDKQSAATELANAQAAVARVQAAAALEAQQIAARAQQAAQNPGPAIALVVKDTIAITPAIREGAAALAANKRTEKVGIPLLSMIHLAGDDSHKLQKSVEDWYNSAMDRVSGWYKYRTQWVLFAIGIVMAVALNANTINIIRQLSKDSTVRQSIVAAAQSAKPPAAGDDTITGQIQAANQSMSSVNGLGIPLGWRSVPVFRTVPQRLRHDPHFLAISLDRIFGWLLTAIAISLGAPFWFDALNKIMVVRSTVKPREKSQDEPSKS